MQEITKEQLKYEVGKNMRRRREQLGLTREALAELADVQANDIYRYESGQIDMRLSSYLRLVNALQVSPIELLPKSLMCDPMGTDPEGVSVDFMLRRLKEEEPFSSNEEQMMREFASQLARLTPEQKQKLCSLLKCLYDFLD